MLEKLSPCSHNAAATRRYLTRFLPAMGMYAVLLTALKPVAMRVDPLWAKAGLMLVPMLPVAYAVSEMLRFVASMDELHRRVQFEAVSIAAVLTCMGCFAWGLLETAGLPRMPVVLVLPLFCSIYGPALWWAMRKYR